MPPWQESEYTTLFLNYKYFTSISFIETFLQVFITDILIQIARYYRFRALIAITYTAIN